MRSCLSLDNTQFMVVDSWSVENADPVRNLCQYVEAGCLELFDDCITVQPDIPPQPEWEGVEALLGAVVVQQVGAKVVPTGPGADEGTSDYRFIDVT